MSRRRHRKRNSPLGRKSASALARVLRTHGWRMRGRGVRRGHRNPLTRAEVASILKAARYQAVRARDERGRERVFDLGTAFGMSRVAQSRKFAPWQRRRLSSSNRFVPIVQRVATRMAFGKRRRFNPLTEAEATHLLREAKRLASSSARREWGHEPLLAKYFDGYANALADTTVSLYQGHKKKRARRIATRVSYLTHKRGGRIGPPAYRSLTGAGWTITRHGHNPVLQTVWPRD